MTTFLPESGVDVGPRPGATGRAGPAPNRRPGPGGGTAVPVERRRPTARRRRRLPSPAVRAQRWRVAVSAASVVMVFGVVQLTRWPSPAPTRPTPDGVTRASSGLVMADAFAGARPPSVLQDTYVLDGSAPAGVGWVRQAGRGLEVGVRRHRGWRGWFAVTIHAAGPGADWHTVMGAMPASTTAGEGESVFAVQTATTQRTGAINYIVVSELSRHGASQWLVGYAHGLVADASTQVLWRTPWRRGPPTTRAVTVRTDGSHRLAVWIGSRRVYASSALHLRIPAPFQAYLEVQSDGIPYASDFRDFWVTAAAPVTVRAVPPGWRVALRGSGAPIAVAGRDGTARLVPPPDRSVGVATLVLSPPPDGSAGEAGRSARSRRGPPPGDRNLGPVPYAGGDVLVVRA